MTKMAENAKMAEMAKMAKIAKLGMKAKVAKDPEITGLIKMIRRIKLANLAILAFIQNNQNYKNRQNCQKVQIAGVSTFAVTEIVKFLKTFKLRVSFEKSGFYSKKNRFFSKMTKCGKLAVDCVSNVLTSWKCLPTFWVFFVKDSKLLKVGKKEKIMKKECFHQEKNELIFLQNSIKKWYGAKQSGDGVPSCYFAPYFWN